ncbi:MAG: ANTAR domain-containing protein [Actinophytocola sp.]|nr:ANTAR domain-containing protein [Actinophytocola sp.]
MTARTSTGRTMTTTEQSLRASVDYYKTLCDQLQHALDSRIVIEQAKGLLAERHHLDLDEAFHLLRSFCRANNLKLTETARAVVARQHVAGLSGERQPSAAVS